MGKRSGPNGFFLASEKGTTAERECCDIGLGLMMTQTQQSFPRKKMMINNTSGGGSFGGETCGVGGNGTLFCNPSNPAAAAAVTSCMMSDIYNVAVGSDFGSVVPKSLQQPYSDTLSFSSSVGGMVRVPFTAAQREELERQTMIYKYMMASVPVPPQLLVPFISKNLSSNVAHLYPNLVRGALELGISSNSDPEPWRCKRTDGKKWRCSRDVAPDQKYCERHAHKKRIRSRKPVESHPNFINTTTNTNMRSPRSHFLKQHNKTNQPTPFSSNTVSSTTTSHGQPRSLAWFMNGETPSAAGSDQEWEQMMQFKVDLKSCCYTKSNNTDGDVSKQQNESSLNLYRGYPGDSQGLQTQRPSHNDQYGLLLTPKLAHFEGALNSNQTQQQTRHFIDAWSTPERDGSNIGEISNNRGYVSPNQNLPFSSLTLSMSRGNENYETNEESESSTQMGLGILGSERENGGDLKSQWMNPLSWMSSPPGGPLAEALCLGITSSTRAASSNGCNSGSTSCRSSSGDVRQEFDLIN